MSVPAVNLRLEKGTDFEATFTMTNSDNSVFSLGGYSAACRIKKHPTATTYKSCTTSITTATGEIRVSLGATNTADLSSGRNYYDVVITNSISGQKTKAFEGMIIVVDTVSV